MNQACVSLEEVFAAAGTRAASLVPETSGYLTLAVADATSRLPYQHDDRAVLLTVDGNVMVPRKTAIVPPGDAARGLRDVLRRLLATSTGSMPGLAAAAKPRGEEHDVEHVVSDIESALIPVNRAAAKRALARLARETLRAKEMGKLRKKPSQAPAAAKTGPVAAPAAVAAAPVPAPAAVVAAPPPAEVPAAVPAPVVVAPPPAAVAAHAEIAPPAAAVPAPAAVVAAPPAVEVPAPVVAPVVVAPPPAAVAAHAEVAAPVVAPVVVVAPPPLVTAVQELPPAPAGVVELAPPPLAVALPEAAPEIPAAEERRIAIPPPPLVTAPPPELLAEVSTVHAEVPPVHAEVPPVHAAAPRFSIEMPAAPPLLADPPESFGACADPDATIADPDAMAVFEAHDETATVAGTLVAEKDDLPADFCDDEDDDSLTRPLDLALLAPIAPVLPPAAVAAAPSQPEPEPSTAAPSPPAAAAAPAPSRPEAPSAAQAAAPAPERMETVRLETPTAAVQTGMFSEPSATRADELLDAFRAADHGDAVLAAARGLRELAGVDGTPPPHPAPRGPARSAPPLSRRTAPRPLDDDGDDDLDLPPQRPRAHPRSRLPLAIFALGVLVLFAAWLYRPSLAQSFFGLRDRLFPTPAPTAPAEPAPSPDAAPSPSPVALDPAAPVPAALAPAADAAPAAPARLRGARAGDGIQRRRD